jgi:hypothetical protein
MAKAFNKGDAVTIISSWDRKGTVTFRHGVVHSCGTKVMRIFDAFKGDEIGGAFRPVRAQAGEFGVYPGMTDAEATEAGIACAAAEQASQRAHFDRCLAQGHGAGYDAGIRKHIDELHQLEAREYWDLKREKFPTLYAAKI